MHHLNFHTVILVTYMVFSPFLIITKLNNQITHPSTAGLWLQSQGIHLFSSELKPFLWGWDYFDQLLGLPRMPPPLTTIQSIL